MRSPWILSLALFAAACGGPASDDGGGGAAGGAAPATFPAPIAGFLDVPARAVKVHGVETEIAARARLFYNFIPAEKDPEHAPIFVLFNGFSAEVVRAYGTGPMQVVEGGDVAPNDAALSRFANLLYVDPRQAGFSYDVLPSGAPGALECSSQVFNEYVDAADVLLAVLSFLDQRTSLEGDVAWIGESYAGVRIQWIVSYIEGRFDVADYEDEVLASALDQAKGARRLDRAMILLEAWLMGSRHAASIVAQCKNPELVSAVSQEIGASCDGDDACACADAHDRSRYNYDYTVERESEREVEASEGHTRVANLEALLGVSIQSIQGLGAADRAKGFKCSPPDASTPPNDELFSALGALPEGQYYYVPYAPLEPNKREDGAPADWQTEAYEGPAFARNVAVVPALITNGTRDLVVPFGALLPAINAQFGQGTAVLEKNVVAMGTVYGQANIDVKTYPSAGHMITMLSAKDFSHDLEEWLGAH